MRRPEIDGGTAIAAVIAAVTVFLVLLVLARLQPVPEALTSNVTAPLTRLEVPSTTASSMMPPPPPAPVVTTTPPATVGPTEVFYRDCVEARADGVVNLHRGDPGYRAQLDRDGDGVACESPPVPSTSPPAVLPAPKRPTLTPAPPAPAQRPTQPRTTTTVAAPSRLTVPTPASTLPLLTSAPSGTTTTAPPPTPSTTAVPATTTTLPPTTTSTAPPPRFTDCNQVVAAGLDLPLTPASPWWNPALDVDGNGLACEDDAPTPPPTTTTTTRTPPVDCVAAWDLGLAPIHPDSPYWNPAWDPDGRGVACAVDPRLLDVSSTSSTTTATLPVGDGR